MAWMAEAPFLFGKAESFFFFLTTPGSGWLVGWWAAAFPASPASPASLGLGLPIGYDLVAESCSGLVSGECCACFGIGYGALPQTTKTSPKLVQPHP